MTQVPVPTERDRIAPTRRPERPHVGTQQWRSLLFLHWPVPVEALRPLVPSDLSLDLHEDIAYVGLVPFEMRGVHSRRWPASLQFNFLETNVRTYVSHRGQPGVYFFSLDASSRLAVYGARIGWGLPYYHARMEMQSEASGVRYQSRRATGVGIDVHYELGEWLGPSAPDTLENFLLERYLLFVRRRGRTFVGQVHHEPYPAQRAMVTRCEQSLIQAAGLPAPAGLPPLVHYAAGVDVEVFPLFATSSATRASTGS